MIGAGADQSVQQAGQGRSLIVVAPIFRRKPRGKYSRRPGRRWRGHLYWTGAVFARAGRLTGRGDFVSISRIFCVILHNADYRTFATC